MDVVDAFIDALVDDLLMHMVIMQQCYCYAVFHVHVNSDVDAVVDVVVDVFYVVVNLDVHYCTGQFQCRVWRIKLPRPAPRRPPSPHQT